MRRRLCVLAVVVAIVACGVGRGLSAAARRPMTWSGVGVIAVVAAATFGVFALPTRRRHG